MLRSAASCLLVSVACGSSGVAPSDAGARDGAGAAYVSCVYTAEPAFDAHPPCTMYAEVSGDLAKCGILDASAAGPLSAAACQANCGTPTCALLLDASAAPGFDAPVIGCGCP